MQSSSFGAAAVFGATLQLGAAAPASAQAPGQESAYIHIDCNRDCLIGHARAYVAALKERDPGKLPLARNVRFTENNVEMPISNHGLWGTVNNVWDDALEVADEETGNAAWFGIVEEHGNPAYLAMRIKVDEGEITEVETIVVRRPDMPKPFGNPQTIRHDPEFAAVLPPEQRRSRERLISVADGYFNTVELNDGHIFTQFHPDCRRLENGIATAAASAPAAGGRPPGPGGGNALALSAGCESQLKLGIYRINKRIRERRYPIIDVERGVIVGTGFFDHANTFDRYTLTDGREQRTVLKWPNSISLLEAFKVVDGQILSIEAVFTYVPYFMHSPFFSPTEVPETR